MKKQLLTIVALLFAAVTAMAQVSLGTPKWNIKDGAKISLTKDIQLSFPEATGVTAESVVTIAGNLFPADEEQGAEPDFDGLESSIANPVSIVMADILDEVQEKTTYNLIITSVMVDGVEQLAEGETITISFTTRGSERKLSWTFQNTTEDVNKIKVSINAEEGLWTASTKGRFATAKSYNYEEVMMNNNEVLPMTEELLVNCAGGQMIVGNPDDTPANNRLQFNGSRSFIIPDCIEGDEVTFDIIRATKGTVWMQVLNAESDKGIESSNGIKDSVWCNDLYSSRGTLKFVVKESGDLVVKVCGICLYGIEILPGDKEKAKYTYSVKAVDSKGNVLKEFIPETEGEEGDQIEVMYSYWMKTSEGSLVTYGTKGNAFKATFDLKSDTTFTINYKSTGIEGVVYLAEMEDFYNAENLDCPIQLCSNTNMGERSSGAKAAYCVAEDGFQLTTLPAGTYKIKAVLFDAAKTPNYIATFMVGSEEVTLTASETNFDEKESGVFTVTDDDTPVILTQSGGADKGVDILAIYATDDVPEEEPDGVASVEAKTNAAKAVRKVVKDGQLLIEGANGTFNVAGAQVK